MQDNLCTQGVATTAASRVLEGYVPPYDATAVSRLKAAGAVVIGKTNMDQFGMGSSTENSAYKVIARASARHPAGLSCWCTVAHAPAANPAVCPAALPCLALLPPCNPVRGMHVCS